jgi:hypothetical protein
VICKARAFPHNFHRSSFWVRHWPTTRDLQTRWEFPSRELSTFNDPHVSCMTLLERRRKPSFQAQINSRHSYRPSWWLRRLFAFAALLFFALDNIRVLPWFIGGFKSSTASLLRCQLWKALQMPCKASTRDQSPSPGRLTMGQ